MTSICNRRVLGMAAVVLSLLLGSPSAGFSQGPKGILYLKRTMNIPFALRGDSSTVVAPGEYTVRIQEESGQPVLTLLNPAGDRMLRNRGDRERVPEKDRTFQRGGQIRITPIPNPKNAQERLIAFIYDFVDARAGTYVRFRFEVHEAAAPTP